MERCLACEADRSGTLPGRGSLKALVKRSVPTWPRSLATAHAAEPWCSAGPRLRLRRQMVNPRLQDGRLCRTSRLAYRPKTSRQPFLPILW